MKEISFEGKVAMIDCVPDPKESYTKFMLRVVVRVNIIALDGETKPVDETLIKFDFRLGDKSWERVSELYVGDNVNLIVSKNIFGDDIIFIGDIMRYDRICDMKDYIKENSQALKDIISSHNGVRDPKMLL